MVASQGAEGLQGYTPKVVPLNRSSQYDLHVALTCTKAVPKGSLRGQGYNLRDATLKWVRGLRVLDFKFRVGVHSMGPEFYGLRRGVLSHDDV